MAVSPQRPVGSLADAPEIDYVANQEQVVGFHGVKKVWQGISLAALEAQMNIADPDTAYFDRIFPGHDSLHRGWVFPLGGAAWSLFITDQLNFHEEFVTEPHQTEGPEGRGLWFGCRACLNEPCGGLQKSASFSNSLLTGNDNALH